ncbi:MAG: inositol monophosphatase family protein [Pseudomonadota bacterium]
MDLTERLAFADKTARDAGSFAHEKFAALESLTVESKGHHDLVSQADRDTETLIRTAIAKAWPDDGIVGEEHERVQRTTGFDWIIDPIDGTANYLAGIPHWCVVIACAHHGEPVVGVIFDPNTGEMFSASKGGGAFVNGKPMRVSTAKTLSDGSTGAGVSGLTDRAKATAMVGEILSSGGMFFRSASGALMLAYVASGRLIGHIENYMNSWDCFAALLMIREAGGDYAAFDHEAAVLNGTHVVAGNPDILVLLDSMHTRIFGDG